MPRQRILKEDLKEKKRQALMNDLRKMKVTFSNKSTYRDLLKLYQDENNKRLQKEFGRKGLIRVGKGGGEWLFIPERKKVKPSKKNKKALQKKIEIKGEAYREIVPEKKRVPIKKNINVDNKNQTKIWTQENLEIVKKVLIDWGINFSDSESYTQLEKKYVSEKKLYDKKRDIHNYLLEEKSKRLPDKELTLSLLKWQRDNPIRKFSTRTFERNPFIAEFIKREAKGICHLCNGPSPFNDKSGNPYLESHHVIWLSKGGEDIVGNVVALCPNCHKKIHILNLESDTYTLQKVATKIFIKY